MENKDPAVKKALEPVGDPTVEELAAVAEKQEQAAQREPNVLVYVHTLSKPLQWEGNTYDKLTFRWDTLTGADHLEIEFEMLKKGQTLVVPEYTGDYLCGMAVRACEEWKNLGPARNGAMRKLPLKDFSVICKKARSFLMVSESQLATAGNGSGNDV